MAAALPGGRDHVADLEVVETSEQDVRDLLTVMKLDALKWILEPSNGTGAIAKVLREHGHTVITNDLNPQHAAELHLDATQLGFWDASSIVGPGHDPGHR